MTSLFRQNSPHKRKKEGNELFWAKLMQLKISYHYPFVLALQPNSEQHIADSTHLSWHIATYLVAMDVVSSLHAAFFFENIRTDMSLISKITYE